MQLKIQRTLTNRRDCTRTASRKIDRCAGIAPLCRYSYCGGVCLAYKEEGRLPLRYSHGVPGGGKGGGAGA